MAEGHGLDDYLVVEGVSKLPELLRRADSIAERFGFIIGRVSRFQEIKVGPGAKIAVEVDPETYYSRLGGPTQRINDYLVIVDLKGRVVLARVSEISRSDLLSLVESRAPADMSLTYTDPTSLATRTILLVEPLMERDWNEEEEPKPASTSIEPQSPVVDPYPEKIHGLLNLPDEGVLLGGLATPSGLVKNGKIQVLLPFKALLQHVLIIGTTGTGKTTLLKNMAAHTYSIWKPGSEEAPTLLFVDLNDDFIQLPFDPLIPPSDDPVYNSIYRNIKPPRGVLVILPVTEDGVREVLARKEILEEDAWCVIGRELARRHVEESLIPIVPEAGTAKLVARRWRGVCMIELEVKDKRITYIPYTINTLNTPSSLVARLMPGLTMLARELFNRTRERFYRKHLFYPPLHSIAVAVNAYLSIIRQSNKREGNGGNRADIIGITTVDFLAPRIPSPFEETTLEEALPAERLSGLNVAMTDIVGEYLEILEKYRPNLKTLEALYRRLIGLVDTGAVDLIYSVNSRSLLLGEEPGWGTIIEYASETGVPIIMDLGALKLWNRDPSEVGRILAYRMLERLKAWKHELWARRLEGPLARKRIIVVIDEAHQFFPQEKGEREEKEESRQVAAMISRIARIGRARGIGLIFATHSPKDLHDIIIQLANTKIILRTEKNQVESIDLPSEARFYIPRLPDRYMVVSSYVYRDYVIVATSPPVTLHYDLSK